MEELSDRIKKIRDEFKVKSQKELATELANEISAVRIADLESGRVSALKAEEAILFQKRFNINPWWLLSGQGEMMQSSASEPSLYYRVTSWDGPNQLILDRNLFCSLNIKSALDLVAIKVKDDNMFPTIKKDSIVIVDQSKKFIYEHKENGLYAICIKNINKVLVRRIQFLIDKDIQILNDNPLYPSETVDFHSVEWVGMVALIINS